MTEALGIFGGTFDPPHIGHQILASEALYQLDLDRVLWVLTPDPPHKQNQPITALSVRLEMVAAAIAETPQFEISRVEIERPAPYYAVETVTLLQAQYPQARLVYLLGGDSLHDLPTWYQPQEFVNSCYALGVMRRPGDALDWDHLETQIPGLTQKVQFVEAPLLEIAASQIRSRIQEERPYRFYLPFAVYQIIRKYDLYQQSS